MAGFAALPVYFLRVAYLDSDDSLALSVSPSSRRDEGEDGLNSLRNLFDANLLRVKNLRQ